MAKQKQDWFDWYKSLKWIDYNDPRNQGKTKARTIQPKKEVINTVPFPGYRYRLEITYKQANQAIREDGKDALINLVYYDTQTGKFWQTPKQAKHLPNGKFIRDINGRLVLKWKFKYYLII